MPNIFGVLNVGEIALLTQQKAIDVTGNNIANVNTTGYKAESVVFADVLGHSILATDMPGSGSAWQ